MIYTSKFMGIDLGTTAVKCVVISQTGDLLAKSSKSYERIVYNGNWMEQNPHDWWFATKAAIRECIADVGANDISGVSFSGHMSAPVFLDKNNDILYNSILIADTRSKRQTDFLVDGYEKKCKDITGNAPIDAFTVSKLLWFKENEPALYEKLHKVIFPKDYIRYCLTGEIGTDCTDAGNSLLYNYAEEKWEVSFAEELGIDPKILPPVCPSNAIFGTVKSDAAKETGLLEGTVVVTGAADMACSQIGSGALKDSITAITLSTSVQIVRPVQGFSSGLDNKMTYHKSVEKNQIYTMASIFSGGLSVDWAYQFLYNKKDMVQEDYNEIKRHTFALFDKQEREQILFLPFLTGSGSPFFNPNDKGGWYGIRGSTEKMNMIYSVFEGISFNIRDNMDILESTLGTSETVYIAGGGSRYSVWPQIIANVLKRPVSVLENKDTSGLGAAILAGAGVGHYSSIEECFQKMNKVEQVIEPKQEQMKLYEDLYAKYQMLYQITKKI